MKKYGFSREPVIWITFVIALLQLVVGFLSDNLDVTAVTAFMTAVSGVLGRTQVTPVADPRFPGPEH